MKNIAHLLALLSVCCICLLSCRAEPFPTETTADSDIVAENTVETEAVPDSAYRFPTALPEDFRFIVEYLGYDQGIVCREKDFTPIILLDTENNLIGEFAMSENEEKYVTRTHHFSNEELEYLYGILLMLDFSAYPCTAEGYAYGYQFNAGLPGDTPYPKYRFQMTANGTTYTMEFDVLGADNVSMVFEDAEDWNDFFGRYQLSSVSYEEYLKLSQLHYIYKTIATYREYLPEYAGLKAEVDEIEERGGKIWVY